MSNVLAEIKRLVQLGRVAVTRHARARMRERGVEDDDLRRALLGATTAQWQQSYGTWIVQGGFDRGGDELAVAVDVGADVVIVTIF